MTVGDRRETLAARFGSRDLLLVLFGSGGRHRLFSGQSCSSALRVRFGSSNDAFGFVVHSHDGRERDVRICGLRVNTGRDDRRLRDRKPRFGLGDRCLGLFEPPPKLLNSGLDI